MGGSRPSQPHVLRPGVIRAPVGTGSSTRRRNDDHLSLEEQERRRIRRERNKMAAAKCRNRRRQLTDSLQNETDELEDEKSRLQKEISNLQKEKEKLELVLEAHRPICKAQDSDSESDPESHPDLPTLGCVKMEPVDSEAPGPSSSSSSSSRAAPVKLERARPKITIPPPPAPSSTHGTVGSASSTSHLESEALHTPVLVPTPSFTPFTASMVFNYPSLESSYSSNPHGLSLPGPSPSSTTTITSTSTQLGGSHAARKHEPCGIAHRRSSSSGDQSDHSLNSPTLLTS